MKVNQAQKINQTNQGQGMENFINPPSRPKTLSEEAESKQMPKVESSKNVVNDVEEKIKELEKILVNTKELDLTTFSELMFRKQLQFKLMFVRTKIYTLVRDSATNKSTVVAVNLPRWGGSSLRYMAAICSENWCVVTEKSTSKGRVLTYKSVLDTESDNHSIDDIFD